MANLVKFYICDYATNYASNYSKYQGGICFTKDTQEIYLDGVSYGAGNLGDDVLAKLENLEKLNNAFVGVTDTRADNGNIVLEFLDVDNVGVDTVAIPIVTSAESGLMSSSDKLKLDSINVNNLVLKEDGKGLSSNDYTDAEKEKLETVLEGAQPNVIEVVEVDGEALTVTNKTVNIELTDKVNTLVGDRISRAYVYRGSVNTVEELTQKEATASVGDVYNITIDTDAYGPAGTNVAWTGSEWDSLGGTFSVTDVTGSINELRQDIEDVSDRVTILENIGISTKLEGLQDAIDILNSDENVSGSVSNTATTIIDGRLTWQTIE